MTLLAIFSTLLSVLYGGLMVCYRIGWARQKNIQSAGEADGTTSFSIVIPARDEAANIGGLLSSIFAQDFPIDRYEVIVVDDHSTDDTAAIVESHARPNLTLLRLSRHLAAGEALNSAKKRALTVGISHAKHTHILTTDGDCTVPKNWLCRYSAAYAADGVVLAAGPVDFIRGRGLLYFFQSLDFMAMQGITAAASALRLGTMSNGANLSFSRSAFREVGGYTGVDHLASGDDFLLTLKLVNQYGATRARYLLHRDAIVRTAAQPSWPAFLQQRIRWASKSGKYNDPRLTAILVLVYAMNVWLLALAVMTVFVGGAAPLLLASLGSKIFLEILFLWPVAGFFGKRRELLVFPLLQPLHILYIVLAGFLGMRGNYRWKGRTVR